MHIKMAKVRHQLKQARLDNLESFRKRAKVDNSGILAVTRGNWSFEFLTRSDTNWSVQSQKKAKSLKFRI